jgi:phospholipase/carboxylesterase
MHLPIEWLPASGRIEQLILLLHGWRSDGRAMAPLAQALRSAFPQSAVLAPDSPLVFERESRGDERSGGQGGDNRGGETRGGDESRDLGRMWYSIADLTPQDWPRRVAGCLPALTTWVRAQQARLGVSAAATALGGFSQGAILSLAAVQREDGLAGRVLAFGGCFVTPPAAAPLHTTVHLFHGGADPVIPADGSRRALHQLGELQGDATLDIAEGIGHELHPALIDCALHRLTHHIPLRTWRAALGAAPGAAPRSSSNSASSSASDSASDPPC